MIDPKVLYHFTCLDHGVALLGEGEAILKPGHDGFVWITDLSIPFAKPLGLTKNTLTCDRTQARYKVLDAERIDWWMDARKILPDSFVWPLELAQGAMPMHWYLSTEPVHVAYDPIRR